MSETIGEAVINVRTDGSSVTGDLGKAGQSGGSAFKSGFSSQMKGLMAAAGIGAVIAGATKLISGSIAEAREAEKVGKTTEAIIKATGGAAKVSAGQVADLAGAISSKTGIDDEAIQKGQNMLLTFKNVRNEVGAGADVFDRASKAAVDLSAAGFGSIEGGSKMLGKALNDPVAGISALSRAGVTFSQTQKDTIAKMVETGDVLGAQKMILAEVEGQVGGVAAANATAGEKSAVAWANFQETLGTALLPVLDTLANTFTNTIIPALTTMVEFVSNNSTAFGILAGVLTAIAVAIGVVSVATSIWTAATGALNTVLALNPIVLVVLAIAALVAILVIAYNKSDTFRAIVQTAFAAVSAAASALWSGIKTAFDAIVGAIQFVIEWVGKIVGAYVSMYAAVISGVAGFIGNLIGKFTAFVTDVVGFFTALPGKILNGLGDIAGAIWGKFITISTKIGGLIIDVVAFFAGLPSRVLGAIGDIAGSIWGKFSGIPAKIGELIGDVVGWFTGLPGKITGTLGDVAGTISGKFTGIVTAVSKIPGDIVALFTGLAGKILDTIGSIDIGSLVKWPDIDIPGNARGTSDFVGGLTMVGEKGPELVALPRHSQITPADETLRLLREASATPGAGVVAPTIHVHLPTGDPEAAAMAMMNRLVRTV